MKRIREPNPQVKKGKLGSSRNYIVDTEEKEVGGLERNINLRYPKEGQIRATDGGSCCRNNAHSLDLLEKK